MFFFPKKKWKKFQHARRNDFQYTEIREIPAEKIFENTKAKLPFRSFEKKYMNISIYLTFFILKIY